uniref:Uncharacterized protein n=1 Tax=Oryza brachyantha TaxID=4533 RepID=J3L6R1_ORYBR
KVLKWWFHVIFAAWWSSIGLGVTSSQDPPFQSLLVDARLAARLGIIGLTALVILYCHLLLAPDAKTTLYTMLTLAMVLHLSFWI